MIAARPAPAATRLLRPAVRRAGDALVRRGPVWAILLFATTPFLRRVIDMSAGFGRSNALGFAPLLACVAVLLAASRARTPSRMSGFVFYGTLGVLSYALVVSFFMGSIVAGAYTFVDFAVPLGAAFVGAAPTRGETLAALRRRYDGFVRLMCWLTLVVSIYGVVQFVVAPPWDVAWIVQSGYKSVGYPLPFQIRVWSLLNSPGTLGTFYAAAFVFVLASARRAPVLATVTFFAALCSSALSMLRASWVATAAGLAVYLLLTAKPGKALIGVVAGVGLLLLSWNLVLATPDLDGVSTSIQQRLQTFTELGQDVSAIDREHQVADAENLALSSPFGQGLGVYGHVTQFTSKGGDSASVDSGYLARFVEFGWFGFGAYVALLLTAIAVLFVKAAAARLTVAGATEHGDVLAVAAASLVSMAVLMVFGDNNRAIGGLLPWIPVFYAFNLVRPGAAPYARSE